MDDIITELSAAERAPISGKPPAQLVIMLHGLGSDGADLISLVPEFSDMLPDAQFLAPNAPFRCDMSPFGYQWFSLFSYEINAMIAGADQASPILNHYIDKSLQRFNLKDKNLVLIGFSQGTMMALYVALRRLNPCAGIVGYSGALLDNHASGQHVISKPPICLVHGMADPVVPFAAMGHAEQRLREMGVEVEALGIPMLPHSINHQGIQAGRKFLRRVLLGV